MDTNGIIFKCELCGKEYNEELLRNLKDQGSIFYDDNFGTYLVQSYCLGCKKWMIANLDIEVYNKLFGTVGGVGDIPADHSFDGNEGIDYYFDEIMESYEAPYSHSQELPDENKVSVPVQDNGEAESRIEKFKDEIKSIDKNLPDVDRTPLITDSQNK